ncbi:MAG: GNAT family N-acetyltransferase, partial [Actinobacteria bacterium]
LRRIRLEALRTDPDAFGSTLEREESRSHGDWVGWLSRCATFVAEDEGGPVGLVGGMVDDEDSRRAVLISMWVAPARRGRGVGGQLVAAVVAWARDEGKRRVTLRVIDGNEAAIALYEKCGFSLTGERVRRDRDGATELVMMLS